jgi:hypothetical protein
VGRQQLLALSKDTDDPKNVCQLWKTGSKRCAVKVTRLTRTGHARAMTCDVKEITS